MKKKYLYLTIKIILSFILIIMLFKNAFSILDNNLYKKIFFDESVTDNTFIAKGNTLESINLDLNQINDSVEIKIKNNKKESIIEFSKDELKDNSIYLNKKIKKGSKYTLEIKEKETIINYSSIREKNDAITIESFLDTLIKLIPLIVLFGLPLYAIYNFKKLYDSFKKKCNINSIIAALYLAMSYFIIINPYDNAMSPVIKFKRDIGLGLIANMDISNKTSLINNFFIIFVTILITSFLIINYFYNKNKKDEKVLSTINNLFLIGNLELLFKIIMNINGNSINDFSYYLILITIITIFIFNKFKDKLKIEFSDFIKLIISLYSLSFGIIIALFSNLNISYFIMVFILLLVVYYFINKYYKKIIIDKININVIIYSFIPLITTIYIELIHILNQYKIFISNPRKYYILLIGLIIIVSNLLVYKKNNKLLLIKNYKKLVYPVLIIGITSLAVQIPITKAYVIDIFESANYSILINDFLNYGKIPILEHYGGHMLEGVFEGIIYGVLNNDFHGAIVSPYMVYIDVVLALLFYKLLKYFTDEDTSLLAVIMLPILGIIKYYGIAIICCFSFIYFIKKSNIKSAIILWLSLIFCALYRLDIGFSFIFSTIFTFSIYCLLNKNKEYIKNFISSLAICGIVGLLLFVGILLFKGISPIPRLLEFLKISLSNINWAYASQGDPTVIAYIWSYIIIPISVIVILLYMLFIKKDAKDNKWLIMILLGFAYVFNFTRGIVRHSVFEMNGPAIIWTAYLFIALFISEHINKKKICIVLLCCFAIIDYSVYNYGMTTNKQSIQTTMYDNVNGNVSTWTAIDESGYTYWKTVADNKMRINRVTYDQETEEIVKRHDSIINYLLEDGETYIDFINKSFLYSALNRKDPVYVAQSPIHLSGEYTQELYVKEIQDDIKNIPLAVMPLDKDNTRGTVVLDVINHNTRYYKVAEFIYDNYVPLVKYDDDFAIWCLKDKVDYYQEKLFNNDIDIKDHIEKIDYGYDYLGEFYHQYNIMHLPYIWGEKDTKKASKNKVVSKLVKQDDYYKIENDFSKDKGNYLLLKTDVIVKDEPMTATIRVGTIENNEFIEKYNYSFIIERGDNNYLFRISNDYNWKFGNINAIKIDTKSKLYNTSIKILEGD